MKPIQVGLLGIGTVGSGTYNVLTRNQEEIRRRAGRAIEITMVADLDVARAKGVVGDHVKVVADGREIIANPDIDIVVELIGGYGIAKTLVLEAIAAGKHVVTANKALLALHGEEILEAAQRQGVVVAFEGAVAVSIPILKALREGLAANEVEWLAGIVNGTSNFVLTQMRERGVSFDDALREAQRLGYAEADPSFDVDGVDSAHKLALLASLVFGTRLAFDDIAVTGIRALQLVDLVCAERLGHRVKLLASARRHAGKLDLRVEPALVPADGLMAGVNGSMNGIVVHGDACGPTMYYGAGAGSLETASAVVADLMDVARAALVPARHRAWPLGIAREQARSLPRAVARARAAPHYLRVTLADGGELDGVLRVLASANVVVAAHVDAPSGVAFITHAAPRSAVDEAIGLLGRGAVVCMPVESLR